MRKNFLLEVILLWDRLLLWAKLFLIIIGKIVDRILAIVAGHFFCWGDDQILESTTRESDVGCIDSLRDRIREEELGLSLEEELDLPPLVRDESLLSTSSWFELADA